MALDDFEVDLFTTSKELEDYLWTHESKLLTISANQHKVDDSLSQRVYCFYNLSYSALSNILEGREDEYEIRKSGTGELIELQTIADLTSEIDPSLN